MFRMELTESRVVEFVAADFEVQLLTIEGVRGVIVKPTNSLDERCGAAHGSHKVDWSAACNFDPLLVETLFVEKDDCELFDLMLLHILLTGRAAGQKHDGQSHKGRNGLRPVVGSS
jgi:hypothetical protein